MEQTFNNNTRRIQFDHRLFERNNDQNLSQEAEARTPDRFLEGTVVVGPCRKIVTHLKDMSGTLRQNVTLLTTDDFVVEGLCNRKAYWLNDSRPMAKSQYGEVLRAELVVEVPREEREQDGTRIEWKGTGQKCVVKMSNVQTMRNARSEFGNGIVLPEDPLREAHALQYMKDFHFHEEDSNGLKIHECLLEEDHVQEFQRIKEAILESHVMLPYDIVQDNESLFLVMPDVGGTQMFHWLQDRRPGGLDTDEAQRYFTQILHCIELLQRAGVCHRDISFENLLITPDGVIVLFDFGMCLKIPCLKGEGLDHRNWTRCLMTYQRPSLKYAYKNEPELMFGSNFDGFDVDMWSLGPILFRMMTGFLPWDRALQTDIRFRLISNGCLNDMYEKRWILGTDLEPDVIDLLQRMMFKDRNDRLSLEQVRAHPWLTLL